MVYFHLVYFVFLITPSSSSRHKKLRIFIIEKTGRSIISSASSAVMAPRSVAHRTPRVGYIILTSLFVRAVRAI